MSRGLGRRVLSGLTAMVVATGVSACGLVPGEIGGGGDGGIDDALAFASDGVEDEGRLVLQYADAQGIRSALGELERPPSETRLVAVGHPRMLSYPRPDAPKVTIDDLAGAVSWSASRGDGSSVTVGNDLDTIVEPALTSAGWSRDGDRFQAPTGDVPVITPFVELTEDRLLVGREGEALDAMAEAEGVDERAQALRDCIGDRPLAVSLLATDPPHSVYRASAIVTEADGDDLVSRACVLSPQAEVAAASLPDREVLGGDRRKAEVSDVSVDGDVVSARLTGPAEDMPHTSLHLSFPEMIPPGF